MEYQCCFCAHLIERPDQNGVQLTLATMRNDGPTQDMFAHIHCLEDRLSPTLSAETVFDARVFDRD